MADVDYPLINGRAFEGASVKVRFLGSYWRGIQALNYGDALEPNYVYELGSTEPIAKTRGQYKPDDISFEILRERADAIRLKAKAINRAWGLVVFSIHVHYDEAGNTPVTDIIGGCTVSKAANEQKAGPDPLIEKWTIKPMWVKRNGIYLHK